MIPHAPGFLYALEAPLLAHDELLLACHMFTLERTTLQGRCRHTGQAPNLARHAVCVLRSLAGLVLNALSFHHHIPTAGKPLSGQ